MKKNFGVLSFTQKAESIVIGVSFNFLANAAISREALS
jgi:hypothetical protein